MHRQFILPSIVVIFLFGACSSSRSTHVLISEHSIEDITPDCKSESFLGFVSYSNTVIRIDVDGTITKLADLGSSGSFDYCLHFLSESEILYVPPGGNPHFHYLNFKNSTDVQLPVTSYSITLSNDRRYIATNQDSIYQKTCQIYAIDPRRGTVLVGSASKQSYISVPIGPSSFLLSAPTDGRKSRELYRVNPKLTVFDTIPNEMIRNIILVSDSDKIISLSATDHSYNVLSENIHTRIVDTLFPQCPFMPEYMIPNTEYFLGRGHLTIEERDKDEEESRRRIYESEAKKAPGEYIDYLPQFFDWIIGSTKTKKLRKIGYKDYAIHLSSSGQHILFSDIGDNKIIIVSVKELLDSR